MNIKNRYNYGKVIITNLGLLDAQGGLRALTFA